MTACTKLIRIKDRDTVQNACNEFIAATKCIMFNSIVLLHVCTMLYTTTSGTCMAHNGLRNVACPCSAVHVPMLRKPTCTCEPEYDSSVNSINHKFSTCTCSTSSTPTWCILIFRGKKYGLKI